MSPVGSGLCPRCLLADGMDMEPVAPEEPSALTNPFSRRIFGDYELLEEVARGGMGVIYRARQMSLGRMVALKVLSSGEFASPEYVARFRVEAAAAARLQHPNIVSIHQIGEYDGIPYFTMDLVEGPNLAQWMQGRTLPGARAAGYLKTLAEAIQHAHDQGILHRDLKPSNILMDPFGEPRITDFGLAKELSGGSELTMTGQVVGTPGYLPPEQADALFGPVTPRSDIYSLGALLYYLLTARAPFVAGSLSEMLRQMLSTDPVAPRLLNPAVSADLETICLKCLERDPQRRYTTAASLAMDLGRFLAGEPIVARPPSALGRFVRWCRRRPALAAAWLLAVALAVGSTVSTILVARAWRNTGAALVQVRAAEAAGRERLREARLAEAQAIRRTTLPGRRARALVALQEAARVRPGDDLRDEALAALLLADVQVVEKCDLSPGVPAGINFDPAGKTAAVRLYDSIGLSTGTPFLRAWGPSNVIAELEMNGHSNTIGPLRFSPDGQLVLARLDHDEVGLWRASDGRSLLRLSGRPHPGGDMLTQPFNDDYDFTPDSRGFVMGMAEPGVSLHRVADGAELARWAGGQRMTTVRVAPDGRHLAVAAIANPDGDRVEILELPGLRSVRSIPIDVRFSGLCWADDSRTLAIMVGENDIALHDAISGRLLKHLLCPGTGPGELHFLANDRLLAYRGRGTLLHVLNIGSGLEELTLDGFGPTELAVTSPDGSFVFSSLMCTATRFRCLLPVGYQTLPAPSQQGVEMAMNGSCLDFSPDGRWLATSHGRYLFFREVHTGRIVQALDAGQPHGLELSMVAFCDHGRRLLWHSTFAGLRVYDVIPDADGIPQLGAHQIMNSDPGWTLSDRTADARRMFFVDSQRGRVRVLERVENEVRVVREWDVPGVYSGALNPAGDQVLVNCSAVGTNYSGLRIRLHRVSDGAVIKELPAPISCEAAWSDDGRIAVTSDGQDFSIIWDAQTWEKKAELHGNLGGDATSFVVSPKSDYSVICRDETISLVPPDGRVWLKFDLAGTTGLAAGLRFLPDGNRFAILWRDGRVDILDPKAMQEQLSQLGFGR